MAVNELCSIPGDDCTEAGRITRGWCIRHYMRWWTHGDPLAGGRAPTEMGEAQQWMRDNLLDVESFGDECVDWPYSLNSGYGQVRHGGTMRIVTHLVAEKFHGSRPAGMDVAHSCGRRICCNPNHLRYATRKENMADAVIHGTRLYGERVTSARLTEAEALAIKTSSEPTRVLAERFGVGKGHICDIRRGARWSWLAA